MLVRYHLACTCYALNMGCVCLKANKHEHYFFNCLVQWTVAIAIVSDCWWAVVSLAASRDLYVVLIFLHENCSDTSILHYVRNVLSPIVFKCIQNIKAWIAKTLIVHWLIGSMRLNKLHIVNKHTISVKM